MTSRRFATFWFSLLALWIVFTPHGGMDLTRILERPRLDGAIWGTDAFGRDLFRVLAEAAGRSLSFAGGATLAAMITGVVFGAVLGMLKGRSRFLLERGLDFLLAFPPMLLALAVQAEIGSGWTSLAVSVSFGLFPGVVRFVSSRAKEIALKEHLEAALALGGRPLGNFRRHYFPELAEHLRIKFPSLFAQALLLEATLSFLNLGVPAGVVSWGSLLGQAKDYLIEAPYIAWVVGIPLVLTLLSLQSWIDDATQVSRRWAQI